MNSYGDDDTSSSSGSEDEVQKQFEISVSRSQSFRVPKSSEAPTRQVSVSRRQKFSRLSDQEEGSTEPSDCEGATLSEDDVHETQHVHNKVQQVETISVVKHFIKRVHWPTELVSTECHASYR